MAQEKLYRGVGDFLREHMPPIVRKGGTDGVAGESESLGVAVSLSGGVDSMVLAFILAHMAAAAKRQDSGAAVGSKQTRLKGAKGKSGKIKGLKAGGTATDGGRYVITDLSSAGMFY